MNPKFIVLLIVPALLGWLLLKVVLRESNLPRKNLFSLLFAPATGFAVISLSVFTCYVLQPQHARLVTTLLPWFFILILLTWLSRAPRNPCKDKPADFKLKNLLPMNSLKTPVQWLLFALCGFLTALLLYTLMNFIVRMTNDMAWNPYGGWDARYFWHLKARFLFRDPQQWRLLFSPDLRWGNNDYPLMVPGIITWGWHFLGHEVLLWPMLVSLILVCSLGALVVWYLAAWYSWLTALTAGVFFFTLPAYLFWGGTLYCDIPYAFFSNSALLLLISGLRLKDSRVTALSAFFAGCSAFTKNEGLVFIGWYSLLAAASFGWARQQDKEAIRKNFFAIIAGLLVPVLVCVYFKTQLAGGHVNIIGKSSPADILRALTDWPRNRVIFEGFRVYMADSKNWNGLWFLLLAAVLYWPFTRKHTALSYSGLLLCAIILINLGYAFVFTITPHNIYKHIQTALMRLLLQTGALALVFTFEALGFNSKKNVTSHASQDTYTE